jgi:hypothetical protein
VLERDERDPERRWRRRLRCAKCRIAPEPEDRWLGIRGYRGHVTLTEAAAPETPGRGAAVRDQLADDALAVLRAVKGPMRQGAIARRLGRGKSDGSVRRALEALVEDERVVLTGGGYLAAPGVLQTPPAPLAPPVPAGGASSPSPP